jgi:hypothetical protein
VSARRLSHTAALNILMNVKSEIFLLSYFSLLMGCLDPENSEVLHVLSEMKLHDIDRSKLRSYVKTSSHLLLFGHKLMKTCRFEGQTYGEALPDFVKYFSDLFNLGPATVFVDVGSGIGQPQHRYSLCLCNSFILRRNMLHDEGAVSM